MRAVREAVRCVFHPRVSREQAVGFARAELERRGFGWGEPVRVDTGLFCYTVFPWDGLGKGGNVSVKVDKRDGRIRHVGVMPA